MGKYSHLKPDEAKESDIGLPMTIQVKKSWIEQSMYARFVINCLKNGIEPAEAIRRFIARGEVASLAKYPTTPGYHGPSEK